MTSITSGEPWVSVPVLSKITVSTWASRSIWAPLLMMMPARAACVIDAKHRGRRGDADAGAVVDDHQRQEAVEIALTAAVPTARPSVGSTRRSANFSAWFCMRVSPIGADSTSRAI